MDEIQDFITELRIRGRMSDNTIRSYSLDLNMFDEYVSKIGINKASGLTEDILTDYIMLAENSGKSSSTIARMIVSVRGFCKYLVDKGILKFNISENLRAPKVFVKSPDILTRTQIRKLFDVIDIRTPIGQRDAAIVHLMYATGIKVSEVIGIRLDDLDMQVGSVEIRNAKKERIIPFDKETRDILISYLQEGRRHIITSPSENLLFVNYRGESVSRQGIWKLIKKYSDAAELDIDITPENLRQSFAAHMIERGADIDAVHFMMGHVSASSMKRYERETKDYIRDVYNSTHHI